MRRLALRRPSRESLRGAWQALIPVLIALPILAVGALIGAAVALNLRMIVILIAAFVGGLLLLSINARLLFAGALLLTYVGVGLATSRRLAFDLRYVRVQDLGSTRSTERFQFIGPGLHVFVSERVFLGFGLGLAGASGPGPAIDGRVGAALVPIGRGYLFGSLEACAAAAIDGDSDSARAAVLLFGSRAR